MGCVDEADESIENVESDDDQGDMTEIGDDNEDKVQAYLKDMIEEARVYGFEQKEPSNLKELVFSYSDIWRTKIGPDEPTNLEPLKITLK